MSSRAYAVGLALVLVITGLGIVAFAPGASAPSAGSMSVTPQATSSDLGWTAPSLLVAQTATNANLGGVALGGDGNGMIVYEKDNAQANILATRYMPGTGDAGSNWKVPVTLPSIGCSQVGPQVAMDKAGDAIAVWQDFCGDAIRSSVFHPATGWGPSVLVGQPYWYSTAPRIAMNGTGGAIAVWETWQNSHYDPWASWYSPTSGWGTPVRLDYGTNNTGSVTVGLDNAGNALAAWVETEAGQNHVVARRYAAGSGWGNFLHLETTLSTAFSVSVAVDSGGNAVVAWIEWDGIANVWADRYDNATGWGTSTNIESQTTDAHYWVGVQAAANNGTAAVVWAMDGPAGDTQSIWANSFIRHVGWGTESDVDGITGTTYLPTAANVAVDSTGNATIVFQVQYTGISPYEYAPYGVRYDTFNGAASGVSQLDSYRTSSGVPIVALDPAGNGLAVWNYNENSDPTQPARNGILANRYTAGSGWAGWWQAQQAEWDQNLAPYWLQLEANAQGDAIFSWTQNDGPIVNGYASLYTPAGGWSPPALVERMNYSSVTEEWSAIDGQGNALVLFRTSDGTQYNVYATYYSFTSGWGSPHRVDNAAGSNKFWLRVALNRDGDGIAGWQEYNGVQWQAYTAFFNGTTQTWGAPMAVQSQFDYIGSVVVGIDGSGNAMAAYQAYNGSGYTDYASYYQPASGWGAPVQIAKNPASTGTPNVPYVLTANNRGDFAVSWNEYDGTHWRSVATEFRPATGWSADTFLSPGTGDSGPATPSLDASGDMLVVYSLWDGAQHDIYGVTKTVGNPWDASVLLSSGIADATQQVSALDSVGNGYAAWTQYNGYGFDIVARRYVGGQGWLPAATINSPAPATPYTDTGSAQLAVDGHGNAILGWNQWHNAALVPYAAEYIVGSGAPNLALTSPADGFLTSTTRVTVSGATDPGATVTIDGASVAVTANGSFSHSYTLGDGVHTFTVVATNAADLSTTETRTVTVDTTAPSVSITSPASGTNVTSPTVAVTGTTEPGATVVVNGVDASVDASGAFAVNVSLAEGANVITATATDAAGNAASARVTVTYTNPTPAQVQSSVAPLDTMTWVLLVLVVASLGLAGYEMFEIRRLRRGGKPPQGKPEGGAPPTEEL